jgi:16S rRNA (cytosine967-C5)-methyltransferase
MIAPARWAAFETLRASAAGRADLPAALARARARLGDERDRALAAEIAIGAVRWRAALDHAIAHLARRPVNRLDPEVLDILRLGAYQLLHLQRVPARAVVDDGVEMTRRAGKRSAAGLVNAVLRAVDRERDRIPFPRRPDLPAKAGSHMSPSEGGSDMSAALEYLSVTLSHPRWLVRRWMERYGFEAAETWARFDNAPAPLTLRVNTFKTTPAAVAASLRQASVEVRPGVYVPDALVVVAGNPLATPLAATGAFAVQDEASQLVGLAAGARPGERVLDACASPGGKTIQMAAAMEDRGLLVAGDVRGRRIDLLRETVRRSGARSIRITRLDLTRGVPFGPVFDRVIVDAPCSGLGTLRRDADIRWKRREEDLPALADAQVEMLRHAAAAVRTGGRLLYATCSSEPEENAEVITRFLATDRRFDEVSLRSEGALPASAAATIGDDGRLRTLPPVHGLEAFFAAMLVKTKDL